MRRIGGKKKAGGLSWLSLFLSLIVVMITIGTAAAKTDFPSKQPITFIVPVSPGGGFDAFTRMLVPYLKKHLPGNPNIIVNNVPGKEWDLGITKLYLSKPDGYTIGIFNMPANCINQMMGTAKFDLTKMTWLGNISEVTYVTALSPNSKYKTLADLKNAPEVTCGVVGIASTAGLGSVIAAQRMGIKMRPVTHAGSTEAIISAIRGNVDWVQYPFSSIKKVILDSHDLVPVWVYSKKRLKLLPNVPTIAELGYPDLVDVVSMYRPIGAPPDLPKEEAKILKDALWKATNDPDFQKKMIEANEPAMPMTSDETAATVKKALAEVAKYKDLVSKYIK